jgi:hypothetical protein
MINPWTMLYSLEENCDYEKILKILDSEIQDYQIMTNKFLEEDDDDSDVINFFNTIVYVWAIEFRHLIEK